jgi:glycosyltransferase involved in cell wall biosynthesis
MCIESVINQTYKDWEMIIIDDGSTDGTTEIVSRYRDSRIIYVRKEHEGIESLAKNYNHALHLSKGEFILVLEGDDYIPPKRLESQITTFEDKNVVLSHGKYAYVFDHGMMIYPTSFGIDVLNNRPIGAAFKAFLQGFNPIGSQSVMIRKSTLLDIEGFTQPNYLPLVDYPTWMKLALKGAFKYIPEVLGYWRRHPQSITINRSEQIFNAFLQYCNEFIETHGEDLGRLGLSESVRNRGAIANLSLAWIKLSMGRWNESIMYGEKSWASRGEISCSFKAKMIIGLIGAYLHVDLPNYFKIMNQWLYQKNLRKV